MKNFNVFLFLVFSLFASSYFSQCTEVVLTTTTQEGNDPFYWELVNSDNESLLISGVNTDSTIYTQGICLEDGCYLINDYSIPFGLMNEAELTISVDGNTIATFVLGSSPFGLFSFGINTDDCAIEIYGCIDSEACNYYPEATNDDGSCTYPGCLDPFATNYNASAGCSGNNCEYSCNDNIVTFEIYMDNFPLESSWAIVNENQDIIIQSPEMQVGLNTYNICLEDGCYIFQMYDEIGDGWNWDFDGMTDNEGLVIITTPTGTYNYVFDNGYQASLTFGVNESNCEIDIMGCMDYYACNYNALATADDNSCTYPGCLDSLAENFDPLAGCSGECEYACLTNNITVEIIADDFLILEGFFSIINENQEVVVGYEGVYNTGTNVYSYCMDDGCYVFQMFDEYGDGWVTEGSTIEDLGLITITTPSGTFQYTFDDGFQASFGFGVNEVGCDLLTFGCMDVLACNYNVDATIEDQSCTYPGCMDSLASNYNPLAGCDDGSCDYSVYGCTDSLATNYNPLATFDDGSCIYNSGCLENEVYFYAGESGDENNATVQITDEFGELYFSNSITLMEELELCLPDGCYEVCVTSDTTTYIGVGYGVDYWLSNFFEGNDCFTLSVNSYCANAIITGCTDSTAINYNYMATIDDESCYYDTDILGCTDSTAFNYNPLATFDDGSCIYNPGWCSENEVFLSAYGTVGIDSVIVTNTEGDYFYSSTVYMAGETELCLPNGCYEVCLDSYSENSTGSIYISYGDNNFYNFEYDGSTCFDFSINTACSSDSLGCTDSEALNYNPNAITDDGSCIYSSCEALFYIYEILEDENGIIIADASSGEGYLNYLWDFGDGSTTTEQFPYHYYDESGTYTICLTIADEYGCQDDYCMEITYDGEGYVIDGEEVVFSGNSNGFSINIISSATISVDETPTLQNDVTVFPIPAKDWLIVKSDKFKRSNTIFYIYDITGKLVLTKESLDNHSAVNIETNNLKNGLYTLIWRNENGVGNQKFTVSR